MALRLELEEAEVDQENVEAFPVAELMGRFLGSNYFIDQEVMDPLFYGMPVSRRRLYLKLHLGWSCNPCFYLPLVVLSVNLSFVFVFGQSYPSAHQAAQAKDHCNGVPSQPILQIISESHILLMARVLLDAPP